ncbi:MAG: TolC family protein [Sumerlaeia bacterium]
MKSCFPTIILALLAAASISCATKIEDVPAPIAMPPAFSATGDAFLPDRWWEDFNDPALDALVEKALTENFSLRSTWDRLAQANALVRRSGAGLWPTLDLSGGAEERWSRVDRTNPATGNTSRETINSDPWSLGLAARYEVDLWGRIRSERNAALLDLQATESDIHSAAISLSANVARTWYQFQEQQEQIALLDEQIETTRDTLQVIESRFKRGSAPASDVLQQRQLLESRFEERERAVSELERLRIALAVLTGAEPVDYQIDAGAGLVTLPPLPATGIPAERVTLRPDVRSAYLGVQSADQELAAAIANRYPQLTLTGSFSDSDDRLEDLFENWVAVLAADLVVPVLDGGARRAEVDRSRAVAAERFHLYAQQLLEALGEVEDALVAERHQRAVVESIEKQLVLSRQVTERIRAEYIGGRSEFLRVLDAQQSQQSLERDLLSARQQLLGFRIDLCRALSAGWDLQEPSVPPPGDGGPDMNYPLPIPVPAGVAS